MADQQGDPKRVRLGKQQGQVAHLTLFDQPKSELFFVAANSEIFERDDRDQQEDRSNLDDAGDGNSTSATTGPYSLALLFFLVFIFIFIPLG